MSSAISRVLLLAVLMAVSNPAFAAPEATTISPTAELLSFHTKDKDFQPMGGDCPQSPRRCAHRGGGRGRPPSRMFTTFHLDREQSVPSRGGGIKSITPPDSSAAR